MVLLFLFSITGLGVAVVPAKADVPSFQCTYNNPAYGTGTGTDTAIGCIPQDLKPFLAFLLKWALGISGGLILLMLIATGYQLLTSQGNPEKLQAAKENIVSIFSGLILIGFSLMLLQVIGANVLILPTFK